MRAIVQDGYGSSEVLRLAELPAPTAGAGEVLVRVEAASIDSGTVHLMTGRPLAVRAVTGLQAPKQPILGLAFAGRVEAVGEGVQGFALGDAVFGSAPGALAELVVARPDRMARIPDGLSMESAATAPISGVTALQALRDSARLQAGQHVLIIGAGGGVGSFAVQLALAFGARVTGVASAAKAPLVRSLGAERVIDYRATPDPADWGRFDVIVDTADGRPLHVLRRALTPTGTLVIVGADGVGGPLLGGADRQLRAMLLSPLVRHRLVPVAQRQSGADVRALGELMVAGSVRAAIDAVVPLERAAEAVGRVERREVAGKVVVAVAAA